MRREEKIAPINKKKWLSNSTLKNNTEEIQISPHSQEENLF